MDYQKKNKLKKILNNIGILGGVKYCYRIKYYLRHKKYEYEAQKRRNGKIDKKYEKLLNMKDIHKGERCFIVATGPSLRISDLEKLKNEYTFSMNSIVMLFDKTAWRPTYYGIQDSNVYEKMKDNEHFKRTENKFIADYLKEEHEIEEDCILFPLDLMDHMYYKLKKYRTKFSDNAYAIVYDAWSITYSIIQIAVYMGFKEIYLLGCDCDYSGPKKHIVDYGYSSNDYSEERTLICYKTAKVYADSHGIKIYNATRGGKLEVFERVDLDKLIPSE